MGWLVTHGSTLRGQIASRSQGWENDKMKSECLAKCFKGNVCFSGKLWSVWEQTNKVTGEKKRFILCDLLEYRRDVDGWGYKDMCESMHPYYYDCPLKYLGMVPDTSEGACAEWRKEVRAHHERKKASRDAKKQAA